MYWFGPQINTVVHFSIQITRFQRLLGRIGESLVIP